MVGSSRFPTGNSEGIPRGWPSRANPSTCKAMKYQPRTQAFRSGFVSKLWRKAIKAAKQNPEQKKAARQNPERKAWVRG